MIRPGPFSMRLSKDLAMKSTRSICIWPRLIIRLSRWSRSFWKNKG